METVVSIPIIALVISGALFILLTSYSVFERLSISAEQQFYARMAVEKIVEDVKQSTCLDVQSGGRVLRLEDPGGQEISYYLSRQQLIRRVGENGIPLSENTSSIEFVSISQDAVQVVMHFRKKGIDYKLSNVCTRLK